MCLEAQVIFKRRVNFKVQSYKLVEMKSKSVHVNCYRIEIIFPILLKQYAKEHEHSCKVPNFFSQATSLSPPGASWNFGAAKQHQEAAQSSRKHRRAGNQTCCNWHPE